jgi:hypothetical protein
MHLYSEGLSRWTISLVRVPPEQQARDKNKAKGKNLGQIFKSARGQGRYIYN